MQDSNDIQQYFSSEQLPTLWRTLPIIEELQTTCEAKRDSDKFALYKDAIDDGLSKLQKYYSRMDSKPAIILALGLFFFSPASQPVDDILLITVLHLYYKFDYIRLTWGGAKEQEKERRKGNHNAKNWQDEASKIVEATVSLHCM